MLTLDAVPLTDTSKRWDVLLAGSRVRTPPTVTVNDVPVPGQHGVLPANTSVYGPGSSVLSMRIYGGTYQTMMANYTALTAVVGSRRFLRTLVDTELNQSAFVQLMSISELEQNSRKIATCTVTFSIPRAFWRDLSDTTVDLGTTGGAKNPSALNGGSAPILDPVFVTVGNGASTDFRVTDDATSSYFRWVGTVSAGQSVRIEPDAGTAWLVPSGTPWTGGTDASGFLTVGPDQFVLSHDAGFTITKTGATNTQVRARRAYL